MNELNRSICIRCTGFKPNKDMKVYFDEFGICRRCYENFNKVLPDTPFFAGENIECLFAPFFYNFYIKKLIHNYKFKEMWGLGKLFSALIWEYIEEIEFLRDFDSIVGIPLSRQRHSIRGYNQAEIIARELTNYLEIPYSNCVHRVRDTKAQSSLKGILRKKNIENAFFAEEMRVKGKNIILVDDVYTTGATMNACAKELKEKGANRIVGIALAKVENNR